MTEEQRKELELIKNEKGLTDKQAQEFLKDVSEEEVRKASEKAKQIIKQGFNSWERFDPADLFKQ